MDLQCLAHNISLKIAKIENISTGAVVRVSAFEKRTPHRKGPQRAVAETGRD